MTGSSHSSPAADSNPTSTGLKLICVTKTCCSPPLFPKSTVCIERIAQLGISLDSEGWPRSYLTFIIALNTNTMQVSYEKRL